MAKTELYEYKLDTHLAEYNALRSEMAWLIKDGTMYQNLVFTLLGVVIASEGWIYQNAPQFVIPSLLVIPFLFSLLGYLFIRQHEEVYIIASYLKDILRPKLRNLLADQELWEWEEFKSKKMDRVFNRGRLSFMTSEKMINILRTMLFLFPSLISLILVTGYSVVTGMRIMENTFGHALHILFIMFYIIDLFIFFSFAIFIFFRTNLRKRFQI